MASEYAKYQQKVAKKKSTQPSSVKLKTEEKTQTVAPKSPPRKRH